MNQDAHKLRIGIIIDNWKFNTFKEVLEGAGYELSTSVFMPGSLVITIMASDAKEAEIHIRQAHNLCETKKAAMHTTLGTKH